MTEMEQNDRELEAFFKAGRAEAPIPSEALLARILADAESERPKPAPVQKASGGFWSSIWADLGGWKTAASMGFAGLVGILIGYGDPSFTDTTASLLTGDYGYDVADLALTASDLWGEG